MSKQSLDTICIQGGWEPKNGEPRQLPIYQSTTFKYTPSEQMGRLFDLEESGYFYTRLANPTNDAVASKICQLEGGVGAMLTSSGQAATFYAILNICQAGDHVISSTTLLIPWATARSASLAAACSSISATRSCPYCCTSFTFRAVSARAAPAPSWRCWSRPSGPPSTGPSSWTPGD